MNALDVRRAVDATVSPLSDITRAGVWQRIEQTIEAPPPGRTMPWRALALSVSAIAVLALVAYISLRATKSPPRIASHRVDARVLDVDGTADVQIDRYLPVRVLRVHSGTIRVRNSGMPLVVETPSSTTWASEPVFAVRVVGQSTEIASGEQASRALLERSDITLSPPPAPSPPPPTPAPSPSPSPTLHRLRSLPPSPATLSPDPDPEPEPEAVPDTEADAEPAPEPADPAAATYALAEAAMRTGDKARAEQLLAHVVDEALGSRLAAAATLDLARLAFDRHDYDRARTLVDRVLASQADPNLHPAARRLRSKLSQ